MKRFWPQEEIDYLTKHFPDDTAPEIASVLRRSTFSIYGKANVLGLKKSEAFKRSHKRRTFQGWEGIEYRFKKGHISWNKGKKGVMTGGIETQFKKGHLPKNTKYNGCITIRQSKNGRKYKWIRIARTKWIMLHVKIWSDSHGAVPRGKIVVFKNGDTMDLRVENLELISLAENIRRNSIQRYPEELRKSMRMLGKLKRVINEKNKSE